MLLHRSREHTYHQMRTDALEDKKNDCWIKKKVPNHTKQIYFQHYSRKQFRTMKKGNHFTTDRCFKAFTQITKPLHASSFNLLRTNSNFLFLIGFVYNFCRSLQILWSPFVVWSPCKAKCFTFIPWYKISGDINERTLVIRGNLRTLRYIWSFVKQDHRQVFDCFLVLAQLMPDISFFIVVRIMQLHRSKHV